uniref:Aminotransferase class I/classII large domain-containing protein n=1 Tax=Bionectria ochroleuca TaxID=29856 RepID=A0A0B7KAQ2_BIOOC
MASAATLASWYPDGTAKAKQLTNANIFERNLEAALDLRRAEGGFFKIQKGLPAPDSVDFSTLDVLSLTSSGTMRRAYLEELARHPEFKLNDGSSRLMSDSEYTDAAEREIAEFHGAETALMLKSGWDANGAIMTAIPRPGDAIVYDELIHASVHEGMNLSLAATKVAFKHNDVDSFREVLLNIRETQQLIREGKRCVLVSVESVYSMDGDVVPLKEMVVIGKEVFPEGVVQFIIDEAHSTGVIGEGGKGLVNELGLEKEIAVRMHTYGKALATSGGELTTSTAAVLCSSTVRQMLVNYGRVIIYSNAPQFSIVAAIRAAYTFMKSGQIEPLQAQLQSRIRYFYKAITSRPIYDEANDAGILSIPNAENWEAETLLTHISYVLTRQRYTLYLYFHLQLAKFIVLPINYPVVPKGKSRVRIVFHARHTNAQLDALADSICTWAEEMLAIEAAGKKANKVPTAARQVYAARQGVAAA